VTTFSAPIPVVRIFDVDKAKAFYIDYLGFANDWEHEFAPGMPKYFQVSRGDLVLHLSEHHGDGSPGIVVYVPTTGVRELHAELAAKDYPFLHPGITDDEIGTCVEVLDPFGNRLRFNER
jgi:catechol 2,3-dioxygenase-like lactoylglutathione lyase family enzyme